MTTTSPLGHTVVVVAAGILLTGCAGYRMEPLAESHPANPNAPAAAEQPRSQTLAYAPSDIPSLRPISPMVPASVHHGHGTREAETLKATTVVGEGEVIATVPGATQLVVEHGEIKGFMEAMTMGYRVDPPSLLAKVQPGDKVRFTIDVGRRAIVEIEKLP
jgi:Cu/Ag efflux protein CusF